jgi:hypothetical protein
MRTIWKFDKMQFGPTFRIFSLTFLVQQNNIFSPTKYNLVRQLFISFFFTLAVDFFLISMKMAL